MTRRPAGAIPTGWSSPRRRCAAWARPSASTARSSRPRRPSSASTHPNGRDPRFGRGTAEFINRFSGDPGQAPSPVLGPVAEPPFHGLRLVLLGTAIGSSGVHADARGRGLDETGWAVPGLYAIGSCAAATTFGSGYNSGMALSRGLTQAWSVARELGARLSVADQ